MPTRPNLLFIYTDEQSFDTLACYGNNAIEMPNLNALADQSMVFDRAYVSQPVCTPSRSTLLTGLWPHTSGCTENNVPLPQDVKCLPEMLPRGEYVTGHYGKWHLGDEIFRQHGFDEWVNYEDDYSKYYSEGRSRNDRSEYYHFLKEQGYEPNAVKRNSFSRDFATRLPEEHGKPVFISDRAIDFINRNSGRPFALYVNYLEPHMPFFGPRDDQYDPHHFPLPGNHNDVPDESMPLKWRVLQGEYSRSGHSGIKVDTKDGWRKLRANYYGLCSLVDTHAGRILQALRDAGLWDDTIVVFTSDHGDMMGSHGLIAKCVMYEEAVRVPMLIKMPGQKTVKRVSGPASHIDVVPTLLEMMGVDAPEQLQGESLVDEMREDRPEQTRDVFIEWNGPNHGLGDISGKVSIPEWMNDIASADEIRASTTDPARAVITSDGWKYRHSPLGEHVLFNLSEDPLERTNLYGLAEHADVVRDLARRIAEWRQETGD